MHSNLGFSGSSRYFKDACPASIRMSSSFPSETNSAAEQGTAAHELGEFCCSTGFSVYDCIGMTFNGFIVDDEMANAVAVYVGYVKSLQLKYGVKSLLEQRVTMMFDDRTDVFGTSDHVLIAKPQRVLHVDDYKHGYGLVEVKNNTQAIGYAISTLDTFNLWNDIDTIHTSIIQPRAQHIDGIIRHYSYTVEEMKEWKARYIESIHLTEDKSVKPFAGDHCKYCKARSTCRARMTLTLNTAYRDSPLHEMSFEELCVVMSEIEGVTSHLNAVKQQVIDGARKGKRIEGYKLVKSNVWAQVKDEKGLVAAAGDKADQLYEKKLVSMSKAKKVLPQSVVNEFYVKPEASTTVVKVNDSRPAINVGSAVGVFQPITVIVPSAVGVFSPVN